MEIFDKLFELDILKDNPPVLLDIGASGGIHEIWKDIAKHSVCLAFDADDREFAYAEKEDSGFKKLIVFNCIVSDKDEQKIDFYLTKSPFCSSSLDPDIKSLNNWKFWDKFEVVQNIVLENKSLSSILKSLELDNIDWFKTDSQGTDLRLLKNIDSKISENIIVSEFEPGIIDAYQGEDKLWQVISFFDKKSFWMSDLDIKGVSRYSKYLFEKYKGSKDFKISPCWGEICYINSYENSVNKDLRKIILGWIFATIKGQHGFALEIILKYGESIDPIYFEMMKEFSEKKLFYYEPKSPFISEVRDVTLLSRVKSRLKRMLD